MANSGFLFGGVLVPNNTKGIYVTATLVPSIGDSRIQPTGFPGHRSPSSMQTLRATHGQICLIESEASMANRLEEVVLLDKYTGKLVPGTREVALHQGDGGRPVHDGIHSRRPSLCVRVHYEG